MPTPLDPSVCPPGAPRPTRSVRRRLRSAAPALLLPLAGCGALDLGALNAAGPIAEGQRHLFFILAVVLVFVAGPVLLLTPLMAWHYRRANREKAFRTNWKFRWWLEGFIWIPPTAIVVGLAVLLWDYTHRLDPYRPLPSAGTPLEVQAVAFDWKWLFIYPERHVAAVNRLAIPVGRPVHLTLTSGTVMQSLLVPQLAGQIYAMAGMRTQLNLAASRPGSYRGQNTQFNGAGFQAQKFDVLALAPDDYAALLARLGQNSPPFDAAAYDALFAPGVPPAPRYFSNVPDGLFQRILADSQKPKTPAAHPETRGETRP